MCDASLEVVANRQLVDQLCQVLVCKAHYLEQVLTLAVVSQVACMVRIEVEKAQRLMFQVTVGSSDVNTSAALKDLIAQLVARI